MTLVHWDVGSDGMAEGMMDCSLALANLPPN